MQNKKAWLRIVEASIAILIVASVLIFIISREPEIEQDKTENIHAMQRAILEQVSLNETLRAEILENNKDNVDTFINRVKPVYWQFATRICEVDDVCGMLDYVEKEVYADEILIAATLTNYAPKKLKLFVWVG